MTAPAAPETPRDAATVVLLRDAPGGLEVLLQRRHAQMTDMGGLYVFPGGKLDPQDSDAQSLAALDQAPQALHAHLCEPDLPPSLAAGLYVAALREALEECGLLLAEPLQAGAPLDAPRARAMLREGQPLAQVLSHLGLRLATQRLAAWSRWITPLSPAMGTRRFDTRFFVAPAPLGQTAAHDNEEATESVWLAPRAALEQYRDGQIELAPPQIMSLAHLARYARMQDVVAAARSQRPPTILPLAHLDAGLRTIAYPGDPLHAERERALPGPTRLRQQG
ncbi:MAG: NUDIX hydrolase, partial [Giesbergeria sp.]